jgi:hypothetical protein
MMAFLDILAGLSLSLSFLGTDILSMDLVQCSCIAVHAVKVTVAYN